MDRLWDERDSCYAVSDAGETVINAALCTIHAQARAAGMAPLDRTHHALLEAWVERVLLGYWRHAGFLNWDSGLGLTRWQIGKTFAFAQQGLLAIAKSPQFHSRNEFGPWAKYLLDQGFVLYQRWAKEDGDGLFAPPFLNDAHAERGGGQAGKWLFAVRMAVNAARAIDLGLGTAKAAVPKPFYAFDPDSAASPSRRPPTRRRCWETTVGPCRTAASRSPGCTTPTGVRSRPSAARRRAGSASSCATRATARC